MEPVASRDEIALDLLRRAIRMISNEGLRSVEVAHDDIIDFENDLPAGREARIGEVSDDLVLRVYRDAFSARQIGEIDPMAMSVEAQLDAMMDEPYLLQARADSGLDHQLDGALFEHPRAHALLDVLAAAIF